jgi:hypothetical protein
MDDITELRCANCDTTVMGEYCHSCGQHVRDPLRSLRDFLRDTVGDIFHLNSRTFRTARDLVVRPGLLTSAYRAGARVRYMQPLQLYLLAAAVFFVVNSFRPIVEFDISSREVSSYLGPMSAGANLTEAQVDSLRAHGISLRLFAEQFRSRVNSNLPVFLIGSVLLFTIPFALMYWRSGTPMLAHGVFVLHWTAFYLLLMAMDRLLPPAGAWVIVHAVAWSASTIWFAFALKRVYAQSWLVTAGKALLLVLVFNVMLALWVTSVISVALRTIE